jgi:hypothetical protein
MSTRRRCHTQRAFLGHGLGKRGRKKGDHQQARRVFFELALEAPVLEK